jgi:hypothetical protein
LITLLDKESAMKLLSAALLVSFVGAALPAIAQQEMQRGRNFHQGSGYGGMHQPSSGQNQQMIARDGAAQRPSGDAPQVPPAIEQRMEPGPAQGRERLTAEERRQLRRDINAAGRDIYRRTRTE